jgi:hypothetical protein
LAEAHLRWGALVAVDQGLPLRDGPVLREARRREAMETERAREAWAEVLASCRAVVGDREARFWFESIELVGEDNALLVLAAPTGTRSHLERRYTALLGEAARQAGFAGTRFASVTLPISMREISAAAA